MPCFEQVSEYVKIISSSNYTIACGTLHIFRCVIQGKKKKKDLFNYMRKKKRKERKADKTRNICMLFIQYSKS